MSSRFKVSDRLVAFKRDGSTVSGTVRWIGRYTLQNEKKQEFSVSAVGIETDIKISATDMESCLPIKHHYFSVEKKKGTLFVREEEVMLEHDFFGQSQQETELTRSSSAAHPPTAHDVEPQPTDYHQQQRYYSSHPQAPISKSNHPHHPSTVAGASGPAGDWSAGQHHTDLSGQHLAYYAPYPNETPPPPLVVGSPVELIQDHNCHGVIRWMGLLPGIQGHIAGVELDAPMEGCGDGGWGDQRYFTCSPGTAFFCPVTSLRPDVHAHQLKSHLDSQLQQHVVNHNDDHVQRYKESKGVPIERAVRDAGLLITDLKETGRELGTGSYGAVVEVTVRGIRCAAKKLHVELTAHNVPAREKSALTERFETECRRVLYIKHTNIIEMIGIHFDPVTSYPTLVMELMDTSLRKYLENNRESSVPLSTKYSILLDVASGLVYLHTLPSPLGPMVHRDLTASNILLALGSRVVAKIADLGQAKIDLAHTTKKQSLSKVPGNPDHMPPEALLDNPVYDTSLDIFSFGVVILHTLTHQWPTPLAKFKSVDVPRNEVERRQPLLDKISSNPLKSLIIRCLGKKSSYRPDASNVLSLLERLTFNPLDYLCDLEEQDQNIHPDQITRYIGDRRGIQGHQNSCYLDATIFGLFALSDVFDSLFLDSIYVQREISSMLWKGIVNPLRKYGAVKHESVMTLRNKLEELGKMEKVNTAEKDPEEFLNMLFKHILHVDPFIQIKRPYGTEPEFFVHLFVEFDASIKIPTIHNLMTKMFTEQHISFVEVPSKLLVQVPRYGKEFQAYKRIIPPIMFNATHMTPQCMAEDGQLELLSVLCIETSHYVCFSRNCEGRWIFFDSMADRVYVQYIPRGVECTELLNQWVYEGDQERLMAAAPRELPELVRRFTQDVYMCVYIQPDYGMYG